MSDLQHQNNTNNTATVAVVILNWNGIVFLQKFIPSVLLSTYNNMQVIVVDNASTDDSVLFLQNEFSTVQIILNKTNEGFAKGYNNALKKVKADYFVLLNSDVEVTPGWIEPIISLMEKDKSIAACQPKILNFYKKTFFEYAGACGGFIDVLGYPFARGRVLDILEEDKGQYNEAVPCFWATGACMFVRAHVYEELGGLDEYFFAHQEEIDLCWRMQLSGYKVYVQPASVVYHVGGGTLPKGNSKKVFLNFRNNLIMIYKNSSSSFLFFKLLFRMLLDDVAALKGLLSGDGGYFIAVIKAHFGFYYWILFHRKKSLHANKKNKKILGVYSKSMLWGYYVKKKKTFLEIMASK